jgi:hypothetical protein
LPRDRFTFIRQPLPAPHFPLAHQSIQPDIELVDGILYFIRRAGLVPLSPGNYKVLGQRRSVSHNNLSCRLLDDPFIQEHQRINHVFIIQSIIAPSPESGRED